MREVAYVQYCAWTCSGLKARQVVHTVSASPAARPKLGEIANKTANLQDGHSLSPQLHPETTLGVRKKRIERKGHRKWVARPISPKTRWVLDLAARQQGFLSSSGAVYALAGGS